MPRPPGPGKAAESAASGDGAGPWRLTDWGRSGVLAELRRPLWPRVSGPAAGQAGIGRPRAGSAAATKGRMPAARA